MAEKSRQRPDFGTGAAGAKTAPCEFAAAAHIEGWADDDPRAGTGERRETVWGGDRDDPRLFYFRALLGSGWFFDGVRRA